MAGTRKLGFFQLTAITAALFLTLRNMPAMAQTGEQMFFFNIVAVFAFLIPAALVSAELVTGWPENGMYGWVKAAYGTRPGLLASWLQWAQSMFGLTSILAYASGTIAYVASPQLGNNRVFICLTVIGLYWFATFLNFAGTKRSGQISTFCLSAGVLLPSLVLIIAGIWWAAAGQPLHFYAADGAFPTLSNSNTLLLFLSFVFGFVGIEVSASNANAVENPQRTFPRAVFTAAILGFVVTLAGALAISFIVPVGQIDTINGAIQALSAFFATYNMSWLTPVLAVLIAVGATGQISTWVVGPVKGLYAAGKEGYLPQRLMQENKNGVPVRLLLAQATCLTLVALVFLVVPSVNVGFLILTSIAILLYCISYVLMFSGLIRLRYTHPEVKRAYKIPGGKAGAIIVSGIGALTVAACFLIGFIPPSPNPFGSAWLYGLVLGGVTLVVSLVPLLVHKFRTS